MKTLRINPMDFETTLSVNELTPSNENDGGYAEVMFKLGDTSGSHTFTAPDARKVSDWFAKLAKKIEVKK